MSNVFDYAIELEYSDFNPVKTIKRPKNKGLEIKPFESNEIPLLIDNVVDRFNLGYQDYLIVRITTGLRTEEINALEIGHVDLKNTILKIEQAIVLK